MVSGCKMVRVSALFVVCVGLPASLTRPVKLNVPVAVGVPLNTPSLLNVMPAGRDPPATDQL